MVITFSRQIKWFYCADYFYSIYIYNRFFYTKDITIQIVATDTTIKMDSDKTLMFWNCGDTTVTEYPFPACLDEMDTLTNRF